MTGQCECGCGGLTSIISSSSARLGLVKGQPRRFIRGHQFRGGAHTTTHGHNQKGRRSPTYQTWVAMRNRCLNPRQHNYPRYGGRGVTVCERWASFANLLADMGERPPDRTLDRIDPYGNYEPSNCRWATLVEQQANKRATS